MTLASSILLASIPILINLYATRYRENDKREAFPNNPSDFNLPVGETFDFIIVGGGTAGCVLARRLTDEKFSVLLLEAGGNPPPLQAIPIMSVYTHFLESINFLYQSTKQKDAALASNGIIRTPGGKMLGGGSSHHDMMYERGNPEDFNGWAKLTGDKSWKYKNLLKYFKRAENYMGQSTSSKGQHGVNGPMTVERPNYSSRGNLKESSSIYSAWLEAGKELGYKIGDSNGPQEVGFSVNEFHHKFGRRVSSYTGYIEPIEKTEKKLSIYRYSVVSEVIIEDKIAKGVRYTRHGIPRVAIARKEVILSAGAYMSPILLIKSGIGPLDQLKEAQIEPVSILSVGHNLMDHPFLEVSPIFVKDHSKAWNMEQNLTFEDFSSFIKRGAGPLTAAYTVPQAQAFIRSSRAINVEKSNVPDLQIYYEYLGLQKNSVTCYIGLQRPFSRGRLTLNNSATGMEDSFLPVLDYAYFSVSTDLDVMIEGINFCLDTIENTKAFKGMGAQFTKTPIPQCTDKLSRSYDYWKCYVRHLVDSTYHISGTCRMGMKTDKRSVVDSKFRVIGVKGLRVVDASIIPKITNANLAASVIMLGEKAADIIKRQYKKSHRHGKNH